LLMLPPASTLFPYTTLFRSRLNGVRHSGEFKIYKGSGTFRVNDAALYLENPSYCSIVVRSYLFRNCLRIVTADGGFNDFVGLLSDRKSTRLNSSHVKISYAV